MKATALLKRDHATVKKLFQAFEKTGGRSERKQKVFHDIKDALDRHAQVEEEIFYPAVRESVTDSEDLVLEAVEEHNVVKSLLGEIDGMSPSDEEYDAKVKVLQESVEHHVREEEGEMFPRTERALGDRLDEIGAAIQAREESLKGSTASRIVQSVKTLIFGAETKEAPRSGSSGSAAARSRGAGRTAKAAARKHRGRKQAGGKGSGAQAKSARPRGKKTAARTTASRSSGARGRATARKIPTKIRSARATSKVRSARAGASGAGRGKPRGGARQSSGRSRARRGR